jgi:thymidylate synthase (FAD)
MFLMKPCIEIMTPIQDERGHELARMIEKIGRTCWQSEEKRETKMERLMTDPNHEPGSWQPYPISDLQVWADRQFRVSRIITDDFLKFLVKVGHESVLEHVVVTVRFIVDRALSHQLVRHRLGAYSQESQRYCDYDKKGHVSFIMPSFVALEPGFYEWHDLSFERAWHNQLLHIPEEMLVLPRQPKEGATLEEWQTWTKELQAQGLKKVEVDFTGWTQRSAAQIWLRAMQFAEEAYLELREDKVKAEDARGVLPNATKTDIVATYNLRQWRHIFKERTINQAAQKPIREATGWVLTAFKETPLAPVFGDFE